MSAETKGIGARAFSALAISALKVEQTGVAESTRLSKVLYDSLYPKEDCIQQSKYTLEYGEESQEVGELQKALIELGLLKLKEPTLYYGDATRQAVAKFQKMIGEHNGQAGKMITRKTVYYLSLSLKVVAEAKENGKAGAAILKYWQSRIPQILSQKDLPPINFYQNERDQQGDPVVEAALLRMIINLNQEVRQGCLDLKDCDQLFVYCPNTDWNQPWSKDVAWSQVITAALIILGEIRDRETGETIEIYANSADHCKSQALGILQRQVGSAGKGFGVDQLTLNAIRQALEKALNQRKN